MTQATRREFIYGSGAYAATRSRLRVAKFQRRPNVVLIMADDHGAWASSPYGCSDVHTPNMGRLAQTGTRFNRALVCTPVCSPSRMTYLTGLLPSAHGVQDYLLPQDSAGPSSNNWLAGHITYPQLLAKNGYRMAMFGKWHMGQDEKVQCGFSDWCTVPTGGGPYKNPVFVHNGVSTPIEGFREDAIGDFALKFLDQHVSDQQKNHTAPFFLSVNFYAPHTPYSYVPEKYRSLYDTAPFSCFPDLPSNPAQNPALQSYYGKRSSKLGYSALVSGVDANIGRVLDKLEELKLREDTLVIYTADHGWNAGHHGLWGKGNGSIPLNMYEESLHVPLIWSHPNQIKQGVTVPDIVSSYDFFPSLLDYLKIPTHPDSRRVGRSYIPLMRGIKAAWRDRQYFEYANTRAVRTETMKYVERGDHWPGELYDLAVDPGETTNRIGDPAYQQTLASLRRDLRKYFHTAGAPPLDQWRTTTRQVLPEESNRVGPQIGNG